MNFENIQVHENYFAETGFDPKSIEDTLMQDRQPRRSMSSSNLRDPNTLSENQMEIEYDQFLDNFQRNHQKEKVSVDSFEILKVLGIGAYGKVLLVKKG